MTDITPRDEVQKLLDGNPRNQLYHNDVADLARSLLAAHDEIDRLQTDVRTYQDIVRDMTAQVEALTGALEGIAAYSDMDHREFQQRWPDLHESIVAERQKDYPNREVVLSDFARAALKAATLAAMTPEERALFDAAMIVRDRAKKLAEGQG